MESGSLSIAAALTLYLSSRRDQLHADPAQLVRLAARAEWEGRPPTAVSDWLADHGIKI